ncbi:MAG TPA: CDGSH iron-sulfur domain-containing protein [Candidatus Nanopelagicales bacterium]|nr:CDGSH iron-sulfur domain-containing protein [Candidatus Nanopelagicales bacterium]
MSDEQPSGTPSIVVSEDGPYLVTGPVTLEYQVICTDDTRASWTWKRGTTIPAGRKFSLCRCGRSSTKPFCDDSHLENGFDGTETASRATHADQAKLIEGPELSMRDVYGLCAHGRFCDGHGDAWSATENSDDDEKRAIALHEVSHCPAGRLVLLDKGGAEIEPDLAPCIAVIEDPAAHISGGLWLRGGIAVTSEDGTPYPVRNRMALCRCGESKNKPFCDGSHAVVKFRDDALVDYDASPDGADTIAVPTD